MDIVNDRIEEFNDKWFPDWKNTHEVFWSNAMGGEVGEIQSITKKRAGGGTNKRSDLSNEAILEEMADLEIYARLFRGCLEFTQEQFETAILRKIEKNWNRMQEKERQELIDRVFPAHNEPELSSTCEKCSEKCWYGSTHKCKKVN